jgi:hypothetical protein
MTVSRIAYQAILATTSLIFSTTGCQVILPAMQPGYPAPHSNSQAAYPGPAGLAAATVIQRTLVFPLPPSAAPEPQSGKASVSGLLFSITTLAPIADTMFYLTPAISDQHDRMPPFLTGPDPARGDIAGRSDAEGSFALNTVPPGNYFLIASAPGNWCEAIVSEDNPTPLLIRLAGGQKLALGVIPVRWP